MTPLGGALRAAARDWYVFPVGNPADPKAPRPGWRWAERNTTSQPLVRDWMRDATAYGIACGPSGLVVIDLDVKPGADGLAGFAALCDRAGVPCPVTYTVATPSGGLHLYFRADPQRKITNSPGRLPAGIDVRGCGGYVLGAGSVIPAGEYRAGSVLALAPLPPWLAALLSPPPSARNWQPGKTTLAGLANWVARQSEGNRNHGLFWAACRAVENGIDPEGLIDAAVAAGLNEAEAARTVASAQRRRA